MMCMMGVVDVDPVANYIHVQFTSLLKQGLTVVEAMQLTDFCLAMSEEFVRRGVTVPFDSGIDRSNPVQLMVWFGWSGLTEAVAVELYKLLGAGPGGVLDAVDELIELAYVHKIKIR